MVDLRKIALCNVLYKIVTKVLANRLKMVLSDIISDSQCAFVPGRMITDNIMVAYELMHYLKRKRHGNSGFAVLKIDISKAYDHLEWGFLHNMMLALGFFQRWVALIMMCGTHL